MYEGIIQELIDELGRLPGIGPKSAQRIAFHILQTESFDVTHLAEVLLEVKEKVRFCEICGNVAEQETCNICRDPRRSQATICVVEEAKDVVAIERTREFRGLYHVLGGAISPMDGIGPDDLRIRSLVQRLADGTVTEVIIATDPNLEGEATATYLTRLLVQPDLRVTRLASGLPVGGDLEYADEVTLGRASRADDSSGSRTRPTAAISQDRFRCKRLYRILRSSQGGFSCQRWRIETHPRTIILRFGRPATRPNAGFAQITLDPAENCRAEECQRELDRTEIRGVLRC